MSAELKPCPFCGGTKTRVQRKSGRVGLACPSRYYRETVICKCGATSGEHKAPGLAVKAWNSRAALTAEGWTLTPPGGVHGPTLEAAAKAVEAMLPFQANTGERSRFSFYDIERYRTGSLRLAATDIRALASRTEREAKT